MKYTALINKKYYDIEIKGEDDDLMIFWEGKPVKIDYSLNKLNPFITMIINNNPYEILWKHNHKNFMININQSAYNIELNQGLKSNNIKKIKTSSLSREIISAPMPGMVIDLKALDNQQVNIGDPLLILEAMKMENEIRSPVKGIIQKINISKGDKVQKDQELIIIKI